ncbi:hypothetical protein BBK82_39240 [Lentzea guizhouensis]|uniref:HTH hxlR-type domain-containing protein n=1 Tax=Lentzea guizhouensis TaxID=1586287 RepID=A0A1B2HTW0_9PSEU|nr:hypothetical protein [Lentzea guizhouensis]ANZ41128.1 hypothetical protein BBK82_39240 [Lentzea guizhouensis]
MRAGRFSGDDSPELSETAVLRVLWMTAQGMVWPWLLQSMCRRDAIERAVRTELISPPVGEHLGYHITDAGRRRIVDWYEEHRPGADVAAADAEEWRAVTLR